MKLQAAFTIVVLAAGNAVLAQDVGKQEHDSKNRIEHRLCVDSIGACGRWPSRGSLAECPLRTHVGIAGESARSTMVGQREIWDSYSLGTVQRRRLQGSQPGIR